MPNYDNLTSIARDAILQINDFKQAQTILENVPNAIFEDVSLIALSYYAEAVKYMMTFSNAMQKLYCIAQLERITVSICRDTLLRNLSEDKKQYTQDELYGIIDVLTDIASVYFDQSELDTAMNIQKTIDLLKEYQSHPDAPELDDSFFDLVNTYIAKYEFNNAIDRLLKAMNAREQKFGQESAETASVYFRLAEVYHKMGKYNEAVDDYELALDIQKNILGLRHPNTATTYNELAGVFLDMREYDKAWDHFNKALHIREEVLGKEHPDTAETYNDIGALCIFKGDLPLALNYIEKARTILEKILGKDHPNTAQTYNNIALVYDVMGDYNKALEYYKKVIPVFETVHGSEHPETAIAYSNIAGVYRTMGDYDKALEYYHKALSIRETVLGTEHLDTSKTYNNIALVFNAKGDYNKALEYYHKALSIREIVLGTEHPDTGKAYNNIALVFNAKGDYDKALEYNLKALAIQKKVLGTEHPDTATTYSNIAVVYRIKGDYDKALEYNKKAMKIREKVLGTEHLDTATTYSNIAVIYRIKGDNDKALEYNKKALTIQKKVLGAEIPDSIAERSNIIIDSTNIISKNIDEKFDELISFISKLSPMKQTQVRSDNAEYLDLFNASLFLDCDNPDITLKTTFIPPLVKNGAQTAEKCIIEWYLSNQTPCMILYGEAGTGKSTLVASIISKACENDNATDNPDCASVLAVALRDHCNLFDGLSNGYSARDIIYQLFGAKTKTDLIGKLLILDGLDELTVLNAGFSSKEAELFINSIVSSCKELRILITSREGYFSLHNLSHTIKQERLCWKEVQVKNWCELYGSKNPLRSNWCTRFPEEYFNLPRDQEDDLRYEIFCIPFILYLCCNSEVDICESKSIGKIYDQVFRRILTHAHENNLIGQDRFLSSPSDAQRQIVYWQYTKEIAYQMFLRDTLDLSDACDLNNERRIGFENAKNRVRKVLADNYGIQLMEADLNTKVFLSVFRFASSSGKAGISFVHKTVYEYFTAVKLYEDYFAKFNKSYFRSTTIKEAAEDVMKTAIAAFRYKAIPLDIFDYLCEMREAPFSDPKGEGFDYDHFEEAFVYAIENGVLDKLTWETPTQEYFYRSSSERNMNPINMQIGRAFNALICFVTGHGFRNHTNTKFHMQIRQILVQSDQYVNMYNWDLRKVDLRGANLRNADLRGADLRDANLRDADLRDADLRGANLSCACLKDANLTSANLSHSNLTSADLCGAYLKFTDLRLVNLRNANLRDSELRGAYLSGAVYGNDSNNLTLFPDDFDPSDSKYGMIEFT